MWEDLPEDDIRNTIKLMAIAKYVYYSIFTIKSGVGTYKVFKWKWNWIKKFRKVKK